MYSYPNYSIKSNRTEASPLDAFQINCDMKCVRRLRFLKSVRSFIFSTSMIFNDKILYCYLYWLLNPKSIKSIVDCVLSFHTHVVKVFIGRRSADCASENTVKCHCRWPMPTVTRSNKHRHKSLYDSRSYVMNFTENLVWFIISITRPVRF